MEEKKEKDKEEKNEGIHKRRRKKGGYKKMEWWKRCGDFTRKFLGRKERGQTRKGGKEDEEEGKENLMEFGEHVQMVLLLIDDRPKSAQNNRGQMQEMLGERTKKETVGCR